MEIKHHCHLEALAAVANCSLREAALQVCYEYYTGRGYPLEVVKQFSELKTDVELFRVFDHIQECKAAPKLKNIPPFWIF